MHKIRYPRIQSSLFLNNRERLYTHLPPRTLVILQSNDVMTTNGDGIFDFVQNSDLFYLSGIEQAQTTLLLYKATDASQNQVILFIQKTDIHTKIWEGPRYTIAEAQQTSAIQNVQWSSEFSAVFHQYMLQSAAVYLHTNEHTRALPTMRTASDMWIAACKKKYPLHNYCRLSPIMQKLRVVKSSVEVELIQKACQITAKAFQDIFLKIQPGIYAYVLEGHLLSTLIQNGSRHFAFPPIIASGKHTCILHYINNNQILQEGDLLLIDIGAEYAHYHADVTRVIPVSGRFTSRQKAVYQAVINIMTSAEQLLCVGNTLRDYHRALTEIITDQLVQLGLLTKHDVQKQDKAHPLYRRYCMHGISHYLGLEVHDVGSVDEKLQPGTVLTIEPGIYIPEENIGIRLENDVLIQAQGIKNLTQDIPIAIEAIEDCMHA